MTTEREQDIVNADVDLKLAGQEIRLRNVKNLNTVLTLVGAVAAVFCVYLLMQHQADAKESGVNFTVAVKEMTKALQEQTTVQREGNCLQIVKDAEQCRRMTR